MKSNYDIIPSSRARNWSLDRQTTPKETFTGLPENERPHKETSHPSLLLPYVVMGG